MASYTITPDYAEQTVTIKVTGGANKAKLQIIIREADDTSAYVVNTIETMNSSSWSETYSGFDTLTHYLVNIRYNSGSWLGAKDLKFPIFELQDITETGVKFYVEGFTTEPNQIRYYCRTLDGSSVPINQDYSEPYDGYIWRQWDDALSPNTEYVANVRVNGYWLKAQEFKTKGSSRPYNWNWYSTIEQGQPIKLSAREWNDFCTKINAFREYKGLSDYSFTTVSKGQPIKASVVNEAWNAINSIPGRGGLPNKAYSGKPFDAYFFKQLRIALNKVP